MGKQAPDITGQRFGLLVAIERLPINADRRHLWRCLCDCGTEAVRKPGHLLGGKSQSCGCARPHLRTHGNSTRASGQTKEYSTWSRMRSRCLNRKAADYKYYGGRGISVCERWQSFDAFLADLGPAPSPSHSIDRIDNDGNYEPGNCRWATKKEQSRNTRATLRLDGEALNDVAERHGITHDRLYSRVRRGTPADLLFAPEDELRSARLPTQKGERNNAAKLTADQVREIRRLAASGVRQGDIAPLFGVVKQVVNGIVLRRTWVHVQ